MEDLRAGADFVKGQYQSNFHIRSNEQIADLLSYDAETAQFRDDLQNGEQALAYLDPYGQKIPGVEAEFVHRSSLIDVAMFAASLVATGRVAGALWGLEIADMLSRDEVDPLDIGLTMATLGLVDVLPELPVDMRKRLISIFTQSNDDAVRVVRNSDAYPAQFTDIQAVTTYLETEYGFVVDLTDVHLVNANNIADAVDTWSEQYGSVLDVIMDEFPEVRIKPLGSLPDNPDALVELGAGVRFEYDGSVVIFEFELSKFGLESPQSIANVDPTGMLQDAAGNIAEGFVPYNTGAATFHELNHLIESWIYTRNPETLAELRDFIRANQDIAARFSPASIRYPEEDIISELFVESLNAIQNPPPHLFDLPALLPDAGVGDILTYLDTFVEAAESDTTAYLLELSERIDTILVDLSGEPSINPYVGPDGFFDWRRNNP